jgi:tetratricopeptide (TPR) repeat protein
MLKETLDKFYSLVGKSIVTKKQINKLKSTELSIIEKKVLSIVETVLLMNDKKYSEAEKVLINLRESFNKNNLQALEAYSIKFLAFISKVKCNYKQHLQQMKEYLHKIEQAEPYSFPYRFFDLAFAYTFTGDFEQAENAFVRSSEISIENDDELLQAKTFYGLGEMYLRQGLYVEAHENLEKAITYFRNAGFKEDLIASLTNYVYNSL